MRRPHGPIDGKKQPDRRIEEFEIARILSIARRTILARNPDSAIEQRADLIAPLIIGLLEGIRIDAILGALAARIGQRVRADAGLEVFERRSGKHMDPPRL